MDEELTRQKTKEAGVENISLHSHEVVEHPIDIIESQKEEQVTQPEDDPFLVKFDGTDDKEDASRLSRLHKWSIVGIISFGSLCVTCISSSWSLASPQIMKHFGISHEVSTLGISLYIWGLGTGGIFLSPISEFHGRRLVYIFGISVTVLFELVTCFSDNIGAMLFGRFMSGFAGSSFMSVASGSFADLFKAEKKIDSDGQEKKKDANKELALAMVLYSVSPFVGPGLGPLIAGFVNSSMNFIWTFIIMLIWSVVLLILVICFVPETYEPINLKRKAKRLRKQTGDDRYYAPIEKTKATLYQSVVISSKRPILLIFRDNMTMVLCFYTGFTLAVVYMFFVAFPFIFQTVYNFTLSEQGMSFLGLVVGMILTCLISPYYIDKLYLRLLERNNGVSKPEFRFIPLMIGVFIVPIGLFIIAWTSYPKCHWIAPIIGSAIYGSGTILVFNGIFAYTVEAYRLYAASAMATNSFIRSIMSGVFPLFGLQMYKSLGIHWATTLLALFAVVLIPIPFLFFKYGEYLRSKSPYAWNKNCLPWSKQYFNENIINTTFENDDYKFIVSSVNSITGDCDVTQRKGKVLCIYDLKIELTVTGEVKQEQLEEEDSKKINATITIPEFVHDQDEDEYEFEINTAFYKKELKNLLIPILTAKLVKFQPDLLEAHAKDVQHASG
ncbi:putative drug/proton antiporter YHK8 [Spathaspora sp. JA1]|nr:putative drug/proton antiporter YHK8 [Spathaspora sp. JA1]